MGKVLLAWLWLICLFPLYSQNKVGIVGELDLLLDDETVYPPSMGSSFQYCEDRKAIVYYNRITNALKYFDYKTGERVGETHFAKQGPDYLGPDPYYFHYHNRDSIFVLSRGTNFSMFLMNSEGKKLNTFHYSSDDYSEVLFPKSVTLFGALDVRPPYVYMGVQISDNKKNIQVAPIIKLDLRTDTFEYLKKPLPYQGFDVQTTAWNNLYYFYQSRIARNTKNGDLIVSYSLEHDVYRLHDSVVEKLNGKSNLIGDFHFLKKPRGTRYEPNNMEVNSIGFSSAWYFGVLYNPYLDQYYRVGKVEQGKSTYRRRMNGEDVKDLVQYSVVVYDSDFKKLGESIITGYDVLFHRGVFVTPDGLCGPQLNLKGEDIMGISIIGLKK